MLHILRRVCSLTDRRATDPLPADVDLYSALVTLPKNTGTENDEGADDATLEKQVKALSGKELGRMKAKKAALARKEALSGANEETGRDTKRVKSDAS